MESEIPFPLGVNDSPSEKGEKVSHKTPVNPRVATSGKTAVKGGPRQPYKRDARTAWLNFRMTMYFRQCFADGATFHWAAEKVCAFADSAKMERKGLCERWFPQFRRWSTEFKFERVAKPRKPKPSGGGDSAEGNPSPAPPAKVRGASMAWRITRADDVRSGLEMNEVSLRLRAAVDSAARKARQAHIDFEFIRKFCALSKLPIEAVEVAWRKIRTLPGLILEWCGMGNGIKFVARVERSVSNPQTSPVLSSPTGRRNEYKQGLRPDPEREIAGATPPAPQPGQVRGESDRLASSEPLPRPGGCDHRTSRPLPARYAELQPWQICERVIHPRKVFAKASWFSHAVLKPIHAEFPRVAWDSRHACNFSMDTLWLGYSEGQICAAWREGVRQSHSDASYAGDFTRPPSAAKRYAERAILALDARAPEVRWAELIGRGRVAPGGVGAGLGEGARGTAAIGEIAAERSSAAGRGPAAHLGGNADPVPAGTAASGESAEAAAERRKKIAGLRAAISKVADKGRAARAESGAAAIPTLGELKTACDARGLTIAQFNGLPYRLKKEILDGILRGRAK